MLSPEVIRIAKGEVVNTTKRTVPFIEPAPEEIPLIGFLTVSAYFVFVIPPPNDIYEGDSAPGINKYQGAFNMPSPLGPSPPTPYPP